MKSKKPKLKPKPTITAILLLLMAQYTISALKPLRQPIKPLESEIRSEVRLSDGVYLMGNYPPYTIEAIVLGIITTIEIRELAECESTTNPEAYNMKDIHYNLDGTISIGSFGLLQFSKTTFYEYAPLAGILNPDIGNTEHQIETAEYMISIGLGNRWSCWNRIE